jgi:cyclopropane-fatty-acyl-phospholipid synthase
MANKVEIQDHYDVWGPFHELRMRSIHGGFPDYSCAFFNGDFSITLEQAQKKKHKWIFNNLGFAPKSNKLMLDVGCGWGPMLNAARIRGHRSVGLTLSSHQAKHCVSAGLDGRLLDWKAVKGTKNKLPIFDGIVSLGAFEHFCSVEEYLAGKQEKVYKQFFKFCADHLDKGGKLYLQTMTWNDNPPDYKTGSLDAPEYSKEATLKRLQYFYPGSWLPTGLDQMVECAKASGFVFESTNNGRLDYIETLNHWGESSSNLWKIETLPETLRIGLPVLYRYLTDKGTRIQWDSMRHHDQGRCFKEGWMSHERMFFRKK